MLNLNIKSYWINKILILPNQKFYFKVIRVAKNTIIGQIADLTTNQKCKQSRLEIQIGKYVKFLVILSCSVASIAFIIAGFLRNWKGMMPLFSNGFLVCAIGMVPCGN